MRKSFGLLGNQSAPNEHLMVDVSSSGDMNSGNSRPTNMRRSVRIPAGPPKNQLSTFMGVVVPCLLNMFGIVLYLKIPLVAASGYGWLLMQILMCMSVSLPTILSMCALATNGKMKAGGSYFMISRSLGPEVGGAIGVVFFLANVLSTAFNVQGMCALLASNEAGSFTGFFSTPTGVNIMSILALILILLIALAGAELFAKSTLFIAFTLVFAFVAGFISLLVANTVPEVVAKNISGPLQANFAENMALPAPNFNSFWFTFGIFFNGFSGFNAGANLSGDLANPARSIPLGTIIALSIVAGTYIIFGGVLAVSASPSTLSRQPDSSGNNYVMIEACKYPPLVWIGIIITLFGASLSSVVGASRILQTVARDKLIPFIDIFGWGSKGKNEPIPALFFTVLLIIPCLWLPSVGGLTTQMFMFSYTAMNLSCFVLSVTGATNFRPTFKYFSKWTALLGSASSFIFSFFISPEYAAFALAPIVIIGLVIGIRGSKSASGWGDVSQAFIYHQVRKYLLKLDPRKAHVKFWRPSLLLLTSDVQSKGFMGLLDLTNHMKKGGLFVIGSTITGSRDDTSSMFKAAHDAWIDVILSMNLKAFHSIVHCSNTYEGFKTIIRGCGLGVLRPNVVMFELDQDPSHRPAAQSSGFPPPQQALVDTLRKNNNTPLSSVDLMDIMLESLFLGKNVCIHTCMGTLPDPMAASSTASGLQSVLSKSKAAFMMDKDSRRSNDDHSLATIAPGTSIRTNPSGSPAASLDTIVESNSSTSIFVWALPDLVGPFNTQNFAGNQSFNLALQLAYCARQSYNRNSREKTLLYVCGLCSAGQELEVSSNLEAMLIQLRIEAEVLVQVLSSNPIDIVSRPVTSRLEILNQALRSKVKEQTHSDHVPVCFLPIMSPLVHASTLNSSSVAIASHDASSVSLPKEDADTYFSHLQLLVKDLGACMLVHGVEDVTTQEL